jgi:uncharacterized protein DUF4124
VRAWLLFCTMLAALAGGVARAEIYEWSDDTGTKHFTTSLERIPAEHRSSARVMVNDKSAAKADRSEPAAAPQPAASEKSRGVGPRARKRFGSAE